MTREEAIAIIGAAAPAIAEIVKGLRARGLSDEQLVILIRDSVEARAKTEAAWDDALDRKFGKP